jgi:hypothetical protein
MKMPHERPLIPARNSQLLTRHAKRDRLGQVMIGPKAKS